MTGSVVLLAAALVATTPPEGDRGPRDFAAANERALAGDPAGAVALYEHLVSSEIEHEDLFFNLGNAHAESGRLVDAIVAYERALRLAPADDDVRANLATVRSELGGDALDDPELAGPTDLVDWVEPIVASLPRDPIAAILLASNAVLFLLLSIRRRAASERRRRSAATWIGVAFLVASASGAVTLGHHAVARDPRAIVRKTRQMKQGPDHRFDDAGQVHAGARVRIVSWDGDWSMVKNADGTTGWLPRAGIETI